MLNKPVHPTADRRQLRDRLISRAWNTPEAGILLGTLFFLTLLASSACSLLSEEYMPSAMLAATLLIYAVGIAVAFFINRHRGTTWTEGYGLGVGQLRWLAVSPLLYLGALPFLVAISFLWHLFLRQVIGLDIGLQDIAQNIMEATSRMRFFYILTASLVTPVYEEILYRGILFPYLFRQGGSVLGTLSVSILFAVMHGHLPSSVPLFMLSLILCTAYRYTGSLWICIGVHAIFNSVSILVLHLM